MARQGNITEIFLTQYKVEQLKYKLCKDPKPIKEALKYYV